jgi:hypothetical protein
MPVLFFILLIVLIAQIGFWKTLGAIVGAALMMLVLVVLVAAVLVIGGLMIFGRWRPPSY